MHMGTDIHQKVNPSWGAKEGLQESSEMLPKIVKKNKNDDKMTRILTPWRWQKKVEKLILA